VLGWALIFLILALVAAAFGFRGVAGTASGMARMLFFLFLVLFVLAVLFWLTRTKELIMLGWALAFLVIALIAALLGFGGVAGAAAGIAKVIFVVFLIAFVLALIFWRRGSESDDPPRGCTSRRWASVHPRALHAIGRTASDPLTGSRTCSDRGYRMRRRTFMPAAMLR